MIRQTTVAELSDAVRDQQLVVDVRSAEEFAQGHIPGAVNMPLETLVRHCADLDTAKPVYLVCGGGTRSMEAAGALDLGGFDARPVQGGTRAWTEAGHQLDR
ncbi:rhodanese-like domain-containing protein [Rhodococcus sp. X156]|uniref:rhodanese-like domain-containing protein n=1 Tax=Rhodococcus sp. X156 TaxID=2499145 RepID=UPI000FDBF294|nr:rhodanese-like domain-containing protein [Rhodococcus sp. X156]